MENKIINFIKSLWTETIVPTISTILAKNKENAERIEKAIKDKQNATDISINNPEDISRDIVEAQKQTTEAIKAIQPTVIPEVDFSSLEAKIEALKTAFEKKEMTVNVGKTNVEVDTKAVVKAIEKMHSEMKEMTPQEVIDYTLIFDEMCKIMERPHDQSEIIKVQELLKKLGTSEDLSVLAEWLKIIAEKEYPQPIDFPRDKNGIPYFTPTKVGGGGGGGLTSIETGYLKTISDNQSILATEETQQSVLAAIQGIGGSTAPIEVLSESFTLTQGSVVSGSYTDTHLAGGVYHTLGEDAANGLDVYYEYDVPDGFSASHVEFVGRYQGSGSHEVNAYAWNWNTSAWEKISDASNYLNHATSDYTRTFDINTNHTSMLGKVRIRLFHETATYNSGHRLYVDHIDVYFTASGATRIINRDNELINPATSDDVQRVSDKIPTYDLYISYNGDGTTNQKIWKEEGTSTVVKTLTYNYSGGNLISKTLS